MKWYEIKNKSDVSEIWLYDEIGKNWFGEGLTAKEFIAELNSIKSPRIDMHINSPGGEVFEGSAIYNAIKRHPAAVTTFIDGIAASIASVIALAGDKVIMAENAMYMMHNPSGIVMGGSEDMRKTADILDKVRDTMVGTYMEKSKKPQAEIVEMLDSETWMDAQEALAAGFIDEISGEMDLAACAKFIPTMTKMGFKHIPKNITNGKEVPLERDIERALRDAGCSSKTAKTILSSGYSKALRDEGDPGKPAPAEAPQRDVEPPKPERRDRVAVLVELAESIAPSL